MTSAVAIEAIAAAPAAASPPPDAEKYGSKQSYGNGNEYYIIGSAHINTSQTGKITFIRSESRPNIQ